MNQEHYDRCIANGCGPRLAEMLASRAAPRLMTDAVAFEGVGHQDPLASVPAKFRELYRQKAKAAGVDINGKRYVGGLAESPGDPKAWVSTRGEAKKLLEERGWSGEGMVNVKGRANDLPGPDDTPYEVSDGIVAENIRDQFIENPEMAEEVASSPQKMADLKEKTKKRLSGGTRKKGEPS